MKRNFTKTNSSNEQSTVSLVEENGCPNGFQMVNPAKVAKRDHSDIMQLAAQLQNANTSVKSTAYNKLQMIAQQMKFLQDQAKHVLDEARQNHELHNAACNFVKRPGQTYHLYKRPSGQIYFSLLSPEEWSINHDFLGSYTLESDQSWTPAHLVRKRQSELDILSSLLIPAEHFKALEHTPMEL